MKHYRFNIGIQFFAEEPPKQDPPKQDPPKQDPPATPTPEEMLKNLMRNSVPKEQYDQLLKEHNEFFAAVANGQYSRSGEPGKQVTEDDKQQEFYRAIDKIYNRKFKGSVEFMENALVIDNYLREHGQRSAFAPSRGEISTEIESQTEDFNQVLKDSLEAADGDDTLCSVYFAKMIDTPYKVGSRG